MRLDIRLSGIIYAEDLKNHISLNYSDGEALIKEYILRLIKDKKVDVFCKKLGINLNKSKYRISAAPNNDVAGTIGYTLEYSDVAIKKCKNKTQAIIKLLTSTTNEYVQVGLTMTDASSGVYSINKRKGEYCRYIRTKFGKKLNRFKSKYELAYACIHDYFNRTTMHTSISVEVDEISKKVKK